MSAWSAAHTEAAADAAGSPPHQPRRRELMRGGLFGALCAGGLFAGGAASAADDDIAFDATSMQAALAALGGVPAVGSQVVLNVPDAAEDGAVVPVSVTCNLPGTREIFIVVESNPNPLVVRFTIPEGTEPFVATRIKMAESSNVYAVVRTGDQLYAACKRTQVTVGGCG